MIIKFSYSIGYGAQRDEMEVDDDTPDDEIEEIVKDFVMERLDWSWRRVEESQT